MKRVAAKARHNWKKTVENQGLTWHSVNGAYWNEEAYYSFTMEEILKLEKVTNELHEMCLKAVQHVIDNKLYGKLHIPDIAIPLIEGTWNQEPPSLYGRFDLAYNGLGESKLLEYNADTPTSLLEASLIQWYWLQDVHGSNDQFNSIHEKLIDCWQSFVPYLNGRTVHFAAMDSPEDRMTVKYIADTAKQAGLDIELIPIEGIGLTADGRFVDENMNQIRNCFKLYPWEWLLRDAYAEPLSRLGTSMCWMEPAWKMVLSNKGILAILSELYPDHPNILRASFDQVDTVLWESYVKKPILSREGAGVTVTLFEQSLAQTNAVGYGEEGYVYQEMAPLPIFDGEHPVIGSWIIGQEAGGMGIREDKSLITGNFSQFVPHLIEG